ncbi:hypothetical protein C3Y87_07015 [Carbonactinospora thermoautotrophica]|uniref:WXG100 family type VII secretion target n=1 Tax=Carbonactinospora thermoautotrophica TaxID=1469144 RepID=UPI00226E6089|nr:type VII secretion target [Carbonactinospora thermoautotrophica]MCX9191163.1 hypothetical protein [Carbonactinospora thermoautotrophica]
MSGRIHADPARMKQIADAIKQTAEAFQAKVNEFGRVAPDVDDAFGVMSESTEALREYVSLAQHAAEDLEKLHQRLAGLAAVVEAAAKNYTTADSKAVPRG